MSTFYNCILSLENHLSSLISECVFDNCVINIEESLSKNLHDCKFIKCRIKTTNDLCENLSSCSFYNCDFITDFGFVSKNISGTTKIVDSVFHFHKKGYFTNNIEKMYIINSHIHCRHLNYFTNGKLEYLIVVMSIIDFGKNKSMLIVENDCKMFLSVLISKEVKINTKTSQINLCKINTSKLNQLFITDTNFTKKFTDDIKLFIGKGARKIFIQKNQKKFVEKELRKYKIKSF